MKHLGGPSAVSWPVFWITLVVAYFALLAGSPDLAAVNPLIRLLTVLAGEAALFAVLGIGQPIWLRCASRLRPWIALLVFAIASAASAVAQGYADFAQRWNPVLDEFDHIFNTAELGIAKPNPDVFRLVCATLEVPPERILFIDDLAENVAGATEAGLSAHQHVDQVSTTEFLRSHGVLP